MLIHHLTSALGRLASRAAPAPGFGPPNPPVHWVCSSCSGPSSTAHTDLYLWSPVLGRASNHQAWMLDSQKIPGGNKTDSCSSWSTADLKSAKTLPETQILFNFLEIQNLFIPLAFWCSKIESVTSDKAVPQKNQLLRQWFPRIKKQASSMFIRLIWRSKLLNLRSLVYCSEKSLCHLQ